MKSASAANLASDLLKGWRKNAHLLADIIHGSAELAPIVRPPSLKAQGKDSPWREQ